MFSPLLMCCALRTAFSIHKPIHLCAQPRNPVVVASLPVFLGNEFNTNNT
ncbi:hypothetical protein EDO6_05009 [Paenibacillus xylanexedens]|nr:hypothetical protein EDO6_05009 [Paenibacillus xylanexedens]